MNDVVLPHVVIARNPWWILSKFVLRRLSSLR